MTTKELIERRCKKGSLCASYNGYLVEITPSPWNNYRACWYKGNTLLECENGITAEQAAKAVDNLEWFTEWYPKYGLHKDRA